MTKVKSYLSLIKFSHTIFAMPFALIGFFLGVFYTDFAYSVVPGWHTTIFAHSGIMDTGFINYDTLSPGKIMFIKLLLVIGCMVFARSSAMSFNRYLDRSFDARNPRTAIREIPAGILKANSVLMFTIINSILFIACTFLINKICFFLSPVALAVVLGYSYTKRFTPLCHLILGLGLSLAPIGAFLAVTGFFALLPIFFSLAVIFWVSGFDIIYSLQDEEFDRSQKLYSIPASLGKAKALHVSEILHLFTIACVVIAGFYGHFGKFYWVGTVFFIAMLIYQHTVVKPNDLSRVGIAFMTANGIASVVFAVFVITDIFTHNFNSFILIG